MFNTPVAMGLKHLNDNPVVETFEIIIEIIRYLEVYWVCE